jgi:hypothetical protein
MKMSWREPLLAIDAAIVGVDEPKTHELSTKPAANIQMPLTNLLVKFIPRN